MCGWLHYGDVAEERCSHCLESSDNFRLLDDQEADGINKNIKQALFKISYGLYVVSSVKNGTPNAQICNTVFQLTGSPANIAICINRDNLTNNFVKSSGVFTVNIVGKDDHDLIRTFGYRSGRDVDKFKAVGYFTGKNGAPILDECVAYLECMVRPGMMIEVGTHTLFVAEVVNGKVVRNEEPMTYSYFRDTKKRGSQKSETEMGQRWVCSVCGHIHQGSQAPEQCPICRVPKGKFILLKNDPGKTAHNLSTHWDDETEEAALYLAFAKKAEEEGFPEVGEAFYRVAQEEAKHAADIAYLQNKVMSTKENLIWLVEAESKSQKTKAEAAIIAGAEGEPMSKEFFIRAAKDEGRHAAIFKGLLERYFKD